MLSSRGLTRGDCNYASRCTSGSKPWNASHILPTTTRTRGLVGVAHSRNSDDVPPEKQAILDRINKAKAYKSGGGTPAKSAPQPAPSPSKPQKPGWGEMAAFLEGPPIPNQQQGAQSRQGNIVSESPSPYTEKQRKAEAERQRRFAEASQAGSRDTGPPDANLVNVLKNANFGPGRGSAYQPAESLRGALQESSLLEGIDTTNMKMSKISEIREAHRRALGAELIVADEAYRPTSKSSKGRIGAPPPQPEQQQQQQQELSRESGTSTSSSPGRASGPVGQSFYEPKVATWGLFPRPSNISSAYGGGRTIRPGEALEDPEQTARRVKANNEALARYKKKMGLEVDPAAEAEADAIYRQGMEHFKNGNLDAALSKFEDASKLVQMRTRVGGFVAIQKAITLDTLGQRQEAEKLYKQVRGHTVNEVSKKAKQMMFGFEAAAYLKADQFTYGVRKGDYDPYFRRIIDKNKVYVPTPEEREADKKGETIATITAVIVITFPFGLAATLARSVGAL